MKVIQSIYTESAGWNTTGDLSTKPQIVLAFSPLELADNRELYDQLRSRFPDANLISASTSGDIFKSEVKDNAIVVSGLEFGKTIVKPVEMNIADFTSAFELGKSIFKTLNDPELAHILIISDGLQINGSELVAGLAIGNEKRIPITGGLAGDNARFIKTIVGLNHFPAPGNVVGIGFYGKNLQTGQEFPIHVGRGYRYSPAISGNRIVYEGEGDNSSQDD